ncbi:hypothetical protein D9M68_755830 [compost metagenome]
MAVLHIGLDAAIVNLAVGHGVDIGDGFLRRVLPAQRLDAVVAGDPDAAAGNGRGAAEAVALLHHPDLQSKVMGAQRGGHRTGSGTHYQYVTTVIPLRAVRAHRPCSFVVVRGTESARILSAHLPSNIVRWDYATTTEKTAYASMRNVNDLTS